MQRSETHKHTRAQTNKQTQVEQRGPQISSCANSFFLRVAPIIGTISQRRRRRKTLFGLLKNPITGHKRSHFHTLRKTCSLLNLAVFLVTVMWECFIIFFLLKTLLKNSYSSRGRNTARDIANSFCRNPHNNMAKDD